MKQNYICNSQILQEERAIEGDAGGQEMVVWKFERLRV